MKKFLFVLMGVFAVAGAFAAGENVPTSKSYVDSKLGEKQDIISANDGATQVLTNTGTAGEYGTKGIYDANGEYATQQNALIDAVTMNTAVQNAIDSEFQCVEYDAHGECLLMDVFGTTATGGTTLPNGYTALEYIEGTGTQYIDTRVNIGENIQADVRFGKVENSFSKYGFIIGGDYHYQGLITRTLNNSYYSSMYNSYEPHAQVVTITDDVFNYSFNVTGYKLLLNGEVVGTLTSILSPYQTDSTVGIFNSPKVGISGTNIGIGKVFWVVLKNNITNKILFNGIPARRDSDGEIGMYDTVSNTFFTNAGTDEFIAGPVVNLYLPSGN